MPKLYIEIFAQSNMLSFAVEQESKRHEYLERIAQQKLIFYSQS